MPDDGAGFARTTGKRELGLGAALSSGLSVADLSGIWAGAHFLSLVAGASSLGLTRPLWDVRRKVWASRRLAEKPCGHLSV